VTLPPNESRRSGARGMAYAMFAVAAALLVMVVLHGEDRPNEGQVAQSGPPPRISADPAAVEKTESRRDDFGGGAPAEARTASAPTERDERSGVAEALGRAAREDRAESQTAQLEAAAATAPGPSAPVPPPAAPAGDVAAPPTAVAEPAATPAAAQPATMAAAESTPRAAAGVGADNLATRDRAGEREASDALVADEVTRQMSEPEITTYEYTVVSNQDVAQLEGLLAANGITIVDGAPPADLPADAAARLAGAQPVDGDPIDRVGQTNAYYVDATPEQLQTLIAALSGAEGKLRSADGVALQDAIDNDSLPARFGGGFGGGGFGGARGGGGGGGGARRELAASRAWRFSALAKESVEQLADQQLQAATAGAAVEADDNAEAARRGGRGGRASAAAELAEEPAPARAVILLRRQPVAVPAEGQP
jgi:hypothetical protein